MTSIDHIGLTLKDIAEATTTIERQKAVRLANSLLTTVDRGVEKGRRTHCRDIGAIDWEARREASAILVHVLVLRVETAVIVAGIVPVGHTRVARRIDRTNALESQLHPLVTLAFLVESWQGTFDLAI